MKKAKIPVLESAKQVRRTNLRAKKVDDVATVKKDNISISEEKKTDVKRADEGNSMPQKRTEELEASFLEMREFVHTVLNMGEDELKKLCRDQKIRIYGKTSMRNKLACALLENHIKK